MHVFPAWPPRATALHSTHKSCPALCRHVLSTPCPCSRSTNSAFSLRCRSSCPPRSSSALALARRNAYVWRAAGMSPLDLALRVAMQIVLPLSIATPLFVLALIASDNHAAAALARSYPGGLPAFAQATQHDIGVLGLGHTTLVEPTSVSPDNHAKRCWSTASPGPCATPTAWSVRPAGTYWLPRPSSPTRPAAA